MHLSKCFELASRLFFTFLCLYLRVLKIKKHFKLVPYHAVDLGDSEFLFLRLQGITDNWSSLPQNINMDEKHATLVVA